MDEEKIINFTTQNSLLHYGRKGMKMLKAFFERYNESKEGGD